MDKFVFQEEDSADHNIGFAVDYDFKIMRNNTYIGHIHVSKMPDVGIYLEWVEFETRFRGNGYFRNVLLSLMDRFETTKLSFETSIQTLAMYVHLGAVVIKYDEFREMTEMELYREPLKLGGKKK